MLNRMLISNYKQTCTFRAVVSNVLRRVTCILLLIWGDFDGGLLHCTKWTSMAKSSLA